MNVPGEAGNSGNEYTSAPGDNANSGKTADAPMASLSALLNAYDLDPGDVIHVDTGTYRLPVNIVLRQDDSGVRILGPTAPGTAAILDRANMADGSYGIEFVNADGVSLSNLSVTGGQAGVYVANDSDSDDLTISQCEFYDNAAYGVAVAPVFVFNEDFTNSGALIESSIVRDNGVGIAASGFEITIRDNELFGNSTGIQARGYDRYYADTELTTHVANNMVHDNQIGIFVDFQAEAVANKVFGNDTGVSLISSGHVTDNLIFQNRWGIRGEGSIVGNRVFNNSDIGIAMHGGVARGNHVYSNSIGIHAQNGHNGSYGGIQFFRGEILNNVVYLNANEGIVVVQPSAGTPVANNTVYQLVGDALHVEHGGGELVVRNNILWSDSGFGISVAQDSQAAIDSDYNLFNQGSDPDAHLGLWDTTIADTLADWQAIAGQQDMNSLEGDPLFIDVDGADNVFGFDPTGDGKDGGFDDNLMLAKHSPAIDSANSWDAPAYDFFGAPRSDDPATPNTGTDDYFERTAAPVIFGSAASAILVTPTSGLTTDEDGATAEFSVLLEGRPNANVVIDLSSSDLSEGSVEPASLVFTAANWKVPQTVTVTGVDDRDVDGDVQYKVVTSAASSADPSYDGLDVADVSMTNADREPPPRGEVVIDHGTGLATHEDGWTTSFSVRLDRRPTADVTISVASSDTTEGTVSPATLTITSDNWTAGQAVQITGVDDDITDGPVVFTVVLGACSSVDPLFDGVDPIDVSVVNADNEQPDITKLTNNALDDFYPLADGGYVGWGHVNEDTSASFDIILSDGVGEQTLGQSIYIPRISDGRLVWTGGSWEAPEVFLYDGQDVLSLGAGFDPRIDGDYVAWTTGFGPDSTIMLYDGTSTQSLGTGYQLTLDSNQVAWIGPSDVGQSVFFFDGTNTFQLADSAAASPSDLPQIDAGQVVWTGMGAGSPEVYLYDGTANPVPHVQMLGNGLLPHLDSSQVAWIDAATDHLMFFAGSTTVDLSTVPINEFDFKQGSISWSTDTDGSSEIYLYDSGSTQLLGTGRYPQIDNGQVVWVSDNEGWSSPSSEVHFYDGQTTMVLGRGDTPWLEDGSVVWQHSTGQSIGVYFYDGNSIRQLSADGYLAIDWPETPPGQNYGEANEFVMDAGSVVWTSWDGNDNEVYMYSPSGLPSEPIAFGDGPYQAEYAAILTVTAADGLLADDVEQSGQHLSAQLAGSARHGTVEVQSDGSFRYTPEPDFWGTDEFTYFVFDGSHRSYPAGVTIEVGKPHRILVSPATGLVSTESGANSTFGIVLTAQPTKDVTIPLSSSDPTEGNVTPATLTFTPDNWSQSQTVTVTGVEDDVADGAVDYLVVTGPATSADPLYQGYNAPDVAITNYDNDSDTTLRNWNADDGAWWIDLPFSFPFYDDAITWMAVTSNGLLHFGASAYSYDADNGETGLARDPRIAPLWDDLTTEGSRDNIHVEEYADHIIIRWNANNKANDGDAQFAAILYADGRVQFEYGPGNEELTPTIGISRGNNEHYLLSEHDGAMDLEYAEAKEFYLAPGYADIGAFEFLGDSDDVQPPRLLGTTPTGIDAGTTVGAFFSCTLQFDEPVNVIDARAPADFDLRGPGANGTFGDSDDAVFSLIPSYTIGAHTVSLSVDGGLLPPGTYQLTVSGTSSIHDQAGNRLDGTNNGVAGDDYVRVFEVLAPGIAVDPVAGLITSEDGLSAQFTVRLESPPIADVTIDLVSSQPDEGTVAPDSVVFTSDNWNQPQQVTVTGVDDSYYDGDVDYLVVTGPAASNDPVYDGWDIADVSVTNRDNDPVPEPELSIGDVDISESDGTATFTVSLLVASDTVVTVDFYSADVEAKASEDYEATSGTLRFEPGETIKTIPVTIVDDALHEDIETFTVTLANAVGAPIRNGVGVGRITDDDEYEGWQNPRQPLDVNNDDNIFPLDVLIIINELNSRRYIDPQGTLPAIHPEGAAYYDVSGDGHCTPLDALIIINYLNHGKQGGGEAEANEELAWTSEWAVYALPGTPVSSRIKRVLSDESPRLGGTSGSVKDRLTDQQLLVEEAHRTAAEGHVRWTRPSYNASPEVNDLDATLDDVAADILSVWRKLNRV